MSTSTVTTALLKVKSKFSPNNDVFPLRVEHALSKLDHSKIDGEFTNYLTNERVLIDRSLCSVREKIVNLLTTRTSDECANNLPTIIAKYQTLMTRRFFANMAIEIYETASDADATDAAHDDFIAWQEERLDETIQQAAERLTGIARKASKQSGTWEPYMAVGTMSMIKPYDYRKYPIKKAILKRCALKQAGDGLTKEMPIQAGTSKQADVVGSQSNLDDSTPKTTSRAGVHLSEQQQTVVIKEISGNAMPITSRADAHLREPDWNLDLMLKRENLVSAFQWSLTDAVGSYLPVAGVTTADVPADLLQNNIVSAPFQRFLFWRCKFVRVRFQIVASRFHQGLLGVKFIPTMLPKSQQVGDEWGNPTRWTQIPHGFLNPADGTVLEMLIPFVHTKGFLDLQFGDALGQIQVQVLNQLKAATGASTSVEVKVFVSFEENHFRVPRQGGLSFKAQLDKDADTLGYTLIRKATKQSGVFQKLGADLGAAAGTEIDNLAKDIIPSEVTGGIAGILLDKPAVTEFPPPLTHKDAQYMSANRGIENLERMTLEPSAQNITSDQFSCFAADETDLRYLFKHRVYLGSFNWAATASVGDILFSTINSPTHLVNMTTTTGALPVVGTPISPTIIGGISQLFTYWRGGIVYIFQVVGTAFHEGRLDFCNHVGTITPPVDYPSAMSQYVNSQTIRNTNNTVQVIVPFHSDTPWKRVWNGEALSDTATDNAVRSTDYVTGSLTVRVAVPLKSPNNVANNVDINVYVAGAEDFEVHSLSLIGGIYNFAPRTDAKSIREVHRKAFKQAGDVNVDAWDDSNCIPLGAARASTYDPKVHHFGESYTNLRECAKRYQTLMTQSGVNYTNTNDITGQFQFFGNGDGGMLGFLFACYRLFRGPMNMKMQLTSKAVNGANIYDHYMTGFCTTNLQFALASGGTTLPIALQANMSYNARPLTLTHPPIVRFSDTQVGEFQVPFQSIYHSLLNTQFSDNVDAYFANLFTQFDICYCIQRVPATTYGISYQVTLSAALGDETRFGIFLGIPTMTRITPIFPNPGSA